MDGWTDGWMDDEWQTGQINTMRLDCHHLRFVFSQPVKVQDNTETTSQDLHLLIHQYRIYRIQAFFLNLEISQRHRYQIIGQIQKEKKKTIK